MAVNNLQFDAVIDDWTRESEARLRAVFRESVKRTVTIMQTPVGRGGNMPIDTGFLRASIRASLTVMPTLNMVRGADAVWTYDQNQIVLTIAAAELGQTVYIGYTANYAGYIEFGTKFMPPRGYVANAVRQWPHTVTQVVADLKNRVALQR